MTANTTVKQDIFCSLVYLCVESQGFMYSLLQESWPGLNSHVVFLFLFSFIFCYIHMFNIYFFVSGCKSVLCHNIISSFCLSINCVPYFLRQSLQSRSEVLIEARLRMRNKKKECFRGSKTVRKRGKEE